MSLDDVARRYAVAVSPHLLSLVNAGDPSDPIARQFLPSLYELVTLPQELADPIGDAAHTPVPGIVHRHTDRVLFKVVASCPVYCRFCFRREMIGPGKDNALSKDAFEGALDYIAAHPEIWEVILTGGDPFILSPRRIAEITDRLAQIAHVKVIRWHTRVPVTDPDRVTDALVAALHATSTTTYVAVHTNHAREFSPDASTAIARLVDGGIVLVSQSVLLKGVNDSTADARALVKLVSGIPAKINLIPFNAWPGAPYECSDWNQIEKFADIVNNAGYASPVRTPRGRDIMAACGQLKSESVKERASARMAVEMAAVQSTQLSRMPQ